MVSSHGPWRGSLSTPRPPLLSSLPPTIEVGWRGVAFAGFGAGLAGGGVPLLARASSGPAEVVARVEPGFLGTGAIALAGRRCDRGPGGEDRPLPRRSLVRPPDRRPRARRGRQAHGARATITLSHLCPDDRSRPAQSTIFRFASRSVRPSTRPRRGPTGRAPSPPASRRPGARGRRPRP